MSITKYVPGPPLRDFVELFWFLEGRGLAERTQKEAILPDGCAALVINLSENAVRIYEDIRDNSSTKLSGSIFCGPQSTPYAVAPTATSVIGVHFRPGGAFAFLPMPLEELRNAHVAIESIYGGKAGALRDRLIKAISAKEKFAILENFLRCRMVGSVSLHRAVTHAVRCFQSELAPTVSEIVEQTGLSSRRFSRIFSEQVGLTPKVFHRVQRFQRTMGSVTSAREVDWARLAVEAGYYDQAHFIHEFHSFCSVTPSTFLGTTLGQRNHLPLRG
jgi:AraC-like DNA-binding protein